MSLTIGDQGPTEEEKRNSILSKLARFGPLTAEELEALIPECNHWEAERLINEMECEGKISTAEEGGLTVCVDEFPEITEDQSTLEGDQAQASRVVERALPRDARTDPSMKLELDEDQARLFEEMRTNVSRGCGYMSESEFVDWILREARRMTEV